MQAAKITHQERWNSLICCWMMLFAAGALQCVMQQNGPFRHCQEWWECTSHFLLLWPSPLTLMFNCIQAEDQICLPCEFGKNMFSSFQDIWFTNKQKKTKSPAAKKHNLMQFTACGKTSTIEYLQKHVGIYIDVSLKTSCMTRKLITRKTVTPGHIDRFVVSYDFKFRRTVLCHVIT